MPTHTVTGADDTELCVEETGTQNGQAILFVHGYSQSRLAWRRQVESELADEFRLITFDLRGHGRSETPDTGYDDPETWGEDIQNIIDALDLEQPVLVGWSYGGIIVGDYLQTFGDDQLAGINFVGAATEVGTEAAMAVLGDEFLELVPGFESEVVTESVDTLETFLRRSVHGELSADDLRYQLGYNVAVPPHVREALHSRQVTHTADIEAIDTPVLISHGEADRIVLPAAADRHAESIEHAETSRYSDVGHTTFWERPERFNRELREFVSSL